MPTEPRIGIAKPVFRSADTERRAGEVEKIGRKRMSREVESMYVLCSGYPMEQRMPCKFSRGRTGEESL